MEMGEVIAMKGDDINDTSTIRGTVFGLAMDIKVHNLQRRVQRHEYG